MTDVYLLAFAVVGMILTAAAFATVILPAPTRRPRPPPPGDLYDQEPPELEANVKPVRCADCGFPVEDCGCNG